MDPYDTLLNDGVGPDVLSVMACTQRMLDTNEKVLASLDEQRREKENIHQAIDDLKKKQEEVVTMLGQIKSSQSTSPSPKHLVSVNREVSVCVLSPVANYVIVYTICHLFSYMFVELTKT